MIPIAEVVAANKKSTTQEVIERVRKYGYNRLPVFEGPLATAADALLADAYRHSADGGTLAVRLVQLFTRAEPDNNVKDSPQRL